MINNFRGVLKYFSVYLERRVLYYGLLGVAYLMVGDGEMDIG